MSVASDGAYTVTGAVDAAMNFATTTTTGAINIGTALTTGTITIGSTSKTGTLTIGQSTGDNTINIGTGVTATAKTQTINIGTGAATGTAVDAITIGSTNGASSIALLAGTGKVIITGVLNATSPVFVTPALGVATGTSLSVTGTITPTSAATGAAALTNILKQTFVIDFGAFAGGGASQNSAQAMTGVAFGDACSVGVDADTSAEYATAGVQVTSAGNIKIVIVPLTAAGTVNPASHTYTVTCIR